MNTQTTPMKPGPSCLQTLMLLLAPILWTGNAPAQEPAAPQPLKMSAGRDYVLTLAGGLPKERALVVYLHEEGRALKRAFALGPTFNKAVYDVRYDGLKLDGDRLRGKIEVRVHPDFWTRARHKTIECAYAIDAQIKDAAVTGAFTGTFGTTGVQGAISGKIVPTAGASAPGHVQCWVGEEFFFIPGPPPDPARSMLVLGFQTALRNKSPMTARMALSDHGENHGSAVVPGLNHQPHGVDGSRLKVSADAIKGPIIVSFRRDCYWHFDPFTNEYEIDAKVLGAEVVGTYKGVDRGVPVGGNIAGELRPKQAPVLKPDLSNLTSVDLSLRWSVGKPHCDLKLTYGRGTLQRAEASYGQKAPQAPSRFDRVDVKIVDDHLSGVVELTANLEGTEEKFRYAFGAIIEGTGILSGYWTGERAGKGIYTKSSKMFGKVTVAAEEVSGAKAETKQDEPPK